MPNLSILPSLSFLAVLLNSAGWTYPRPVPALPTVEVAATRTPTTPREMNVLRQPLPLSTPASPCCRLLAPDQIHPGCEKMHPLALGYSSAGESPYLRPAASAHTFPIRQNRQLVTCSWKPCTARLRLDRFHHPQDPRGTTRALSRATCSRV